MKTTPPTLRFVRFALRAIFAERPFRQAAGLVFAAVAAVAPFSVPWLVSRAAAAVAAPRDPSVVADLAAVGWLIAGAYAAVFVCWRLVDALALAPSADTVVAVHREAFSRLLGKSWRYHADRMVGSTARAAFRLAESADNLLGWMTFTLFPFVSAMAVSLSVIAAQDVRLGWFSLAWLAVVVALSYVLFRWQAKFVDAYYESETALTGRMADVVGNAQLSWLFSSRARELAGLAPAARDFRRATVRYWYTNAVVYGSVNLMLVLFIAVVAVWGARAYADGTVAGPTYLAMLMYVVPVATQAFALPQVIREFFRNASSAAPMLADLDEPDEVRDVSGAPALSVARGAVKFSGVTFGYDPVRPVITGLDLEMAPGERVAVVGPSGAGKSTLTRLLLRFFDLRSGRIEIDGQDVAAVTQESLRAAVSVVPQEPWLLHRSIRENVAYGKEGAADAQVWSALELAQARDFVEKLPQGLDSVVGERGVKLSGGERQRLCIARAALKDAKIVIMDEPTSALDSVSERAIQAAMRDLMKGRTSVVIAHRLSTVMDADRIVVMDRGAVAEQGTHAQLLAAGGLYAQLWNLQAGGMLGDTADT